MRTIHNLSEPTSFPQFLDGVDIMLRCWDYCCWAAAGLVSWWKVAENCVAIGREFYHQSGDTVTCPNTLNIRAANDPSVFNKALKIDGSFAALLNMARVIFNVLVLLNQSARARSVLCCLWWKMHSNIDNEWTLYGEIIFLAAFAMNHYEPTKQQLFNHDNADEEFSLTSSIFFRSF